MVPASKNILSVVVLLQPPFYIGSTAGVCYTINRTF